MKNKMSVSDKIEALNNALVSFKFPTKYFIKTNEIDGKKFALYTKGEHGAIYIHSSYMNYDEFNYYLKGYNDAKNNKFNN